MPNSYSGERNLHTVEFCGALVWLAQVVSSLAFRKKDPKTFTDLSYVWSTVGLIVMVIYNIKRASRILSARINYDNQINMLGLFIKAIGLTAFALYVSPDILGDVNVSRFGEYLFWNLVFNLGYHGLRMNVFKQSVLISGWLFIADLSAALLADGMVLASGLYASVALLSMFYYLVPDNLI